MPRYSRAKRAGFKAYEYKCLECGWDSIYKEDITRHVRNWSREGQLIPHYMDARGICYRKKEEIQ